MAFEILRLVGARAVVKGDDVNGVFGSTTLDTTEWDEVNADRKFSQAKDDFDAAVEAFFAPITNAAEQLNKMAEQPEVDPATYVVIDEGSAGSPSKPKILHHLSRDSVILRLVEQGETSRLVWVNDELEILAPVVHSVTNVPAPAEDEVVENPMVEDAPA